MVSIAQLESAPSTPDPFGRLPVNNEPPAIEIEFPEEDPNQYEVERLVNRRKIRKRFQYLIK